MSESFLDLFVSNKMGFHSKHSYNKSRREGLDRARDNKIVISETDLTIEDKLSEINDRIKRVEEDLKIPSLRDNLLIKNKLENLKKMKEKLENERTKIN